MTQAPRLRPQERSVSKVEHHPIMRFSSGTDELLAQGITQRISLPVGTGDGSDLFLKTLQNVFEEAQLRGQENPIAVGVIPFDLNEKTNIYVPYSYIWQPRGADGDQLPGGADAAPTANRLLRSTSTPDQMAFERAVEMAVMNFKMSEVEKVVLGVRQHLEFEAPVDVDKLAANLRRQNPTQYNFCVPMFDGSTLVGASPELLIRKSGAAFMSNPLAGSAKRSPDMDRDAEIARALSKSQKDLYEHKIVVDSLRALLSDFCKTLSVPEQPSLLHTETLWHLSTKITGRLRDPDMSALQLACRLHPTPAMCGHPTERAYRLMRFLEPFNRDFFTGMVGWCDARGNGEWVQVIRSGRVARNTVNLFAGVGVVEASDPASEWREAQTKLETMLNACRRC